MGKRKSSKDFRTLRALLPDKAFALRCDKRPGPTDLVRKRVWRGIMHLPDDVAITTSNHHGTQLAALYTLWGDWLEAIGEKEEDALFSPMLDAADCFQSITCTAITARHCPTCAAPSNWSRSVRWGTSRRLTRCM
jgi:hypothetical protein